MNTMAMTFTIFDTLGFAKRLEEAGMEPKIAEAHAELQAEFQEKIFEAFAEYKPTLDNFKANQQELATKGDINELRYELKEDISELKDDIDELRSEINGIKADICALDRRLNKIEARLDRMEGKIDCLRNELIFKLGGIMVAGITVMGTILALILNHVH